MNSVDGRRLVFIGGLHRSGTTALGRLISSHPMASGIEQSPAIEDEGQHLQSVYDPAHVHGGPGRFANSPRAHLTDLHAAQIPDAANRLWRSWSPYWDTTKPLLVEKSPPNMIMGRYLQSVFPGSALVCIVRNPIVVALSTKKWAKTRSLEQLVEHWSVAHNLLRADSKQIKRLHVLRYEDMVTKPYETLQPLQQYLGLDTPLTPTDLQTNRSNRYVIEWQELRNGLPWQRRQYGRIVRRYGPMLTEYGYDPDDLTHTEDGGLSHLF